MKLILGTASFGIKPYGEGVTHPPTEEDIRKILQVAYRGGIRILEGSEAYDCDWVLKDKRFDVIYKTKHPYSVSTILNNLERLELMGLLYHHGFTTRSESIEKDKRIGYTGASIYSHEQITGREDMLEVPLNIEDTKFKGVSGPIKLVRSVFGRGKLLKKYSVKECLDFVKSCPNVQGVIVGVNHYSELEAILKAWHE